MLQLLKCLPAEVITTKQATAHDVTALHIIQSIFNCADVIGGIWEGFILSSDEGSAY
jgi:hypothetical protein